MSMFNQPTISEAKRTVTTNLAGGEAYKVNPKFEFVSILLTSFLQDKFYKTAKTEMSDVVRLIPLVGYEFAAKAALFARNEFGMRSITHVVGGEIAKNVKGATWTKNFYRALFKRADDMQEVVAYFAAQNGGSLHPMPNALKKAIRETLSNIDAYSLAKYRGEGKTIKMVDLVNLTHPKRTAQIDSLMKGTLKSMETWETKLTQAGQQAESEEDKVERKADAWKDLLENNKLGYLALIRNCRNIANQAPKEVPLLCKALVNPVAIKKSLIFPFQIQKAMEELQKAGVSQSILGALSDAMDISVSNVPTFDGKTLIVVDESGSMRGKPIEIASLFAAALYKSNNDSDLMFFANTARYVSMNPKEPVTTIAERIQRSAVMGGTDFKAIFDTIRNEKYERIIILSDMQGWVDYHSPLTKFNTWCRKVGKVPYVYSFDLNGYGTSQFPESKTFLLSGFSDKIFDIMASLEQDKDALVNKIEAITL